MRLQHVANDSDGPLADALRLMMKTQDHRIAGFEGDQGLEHRGRNWIGDGHNREHDPDRTRQLRHLSVGVEEERALGDLSGQRRVDPEAGKTVLQRLVRRVPHPGFPDSGNGEFLGAAGKRFRDVEQHPVNPFVAPVLERLLGRAGTGDDGIDFLIEARVVRKRFQQAIRSGVQGGRACLVQRANQSQSDGWVRVGQDVENCGHVGRKIVDGEPREAVEHHETHDSLSFVGNS